MTIAYPLGDSLYLNVTNRCSNACDFCVRDEANGGSVGGYNLWLVREPTVEEIIAELEKHELANYREVVFCGFGEPFMRFDDCRAVAMWLKERNKRVRVNTNGQGSLLCGRNITSEMTGLFDVVSISLNNKTAEEYQQHCNSDFGKESFSALLDFGEQCAALGMETIFTVVDVLPKEDIEACRQLAASRGCGFRVREIIKS